MILQLCLVSESTVALLTLKVVGLLVFHKGSLADEASIAVLALEWPLGLWLVGPLVQEAVRASAICLLAVFTTVKCPDRLVGVDSSMAHGFM